MKLTTTSKSVSDRPEDILILGNAENRRTRHLRDAFTQVHGITPGVLAWGDFLDHPSSLGSALAGKAKLRIDSPGENYEVWRRLVQLGLPEGTLGPATGPDYGRVHYRDAWFRGFCRALEAIEEQVPATQHVGNTPQAIRRSYDKCATHNVLMREAIPRPTVLDVGSRAELQTAMHEHGLRQVFLKPRYSSSASGIVALRVHPDGRGVATTSLEARNGHWYNALRIRRTTDPREIEALLDHTFSEATIVERWIPKFGIAGHSIDLRIVTCDDHAHQCVARGSRTPMTNLHLGNARIPLEQVQAVIGRPAFERACEIAVAATRATGCQQAGVDILLDPRGQAWVLEVNAFGDLLPGIEHHGKTTYETQAQALTT